MARATRYEVGTEEECSKRLVGDMQARFYKACAEELVGRFRRLNADYITAQQLLWKHALQLNKTPTGEAQAPGPRGEAAQR